MIEFLANRADKPYGKLKYVYVVERRRGGRFHNHIVTNFAEPNVVKSFWNLGRHSDARMLDTDEDFGLEGLARYVAKECKHKEEFKKSFGYSQNLHRSWQYAITNEGHVDKRTAAKIANDCVAARAWFEREYQDCDFLDLEVSTNPFTGQPYIYAKLKLKNGIGT
jgi:hypothetical protein